ncbi:hypothetical protein CIG75_18445 [Tumebacillus algifaecis]|uniref:DUF4399 domain-containing protein n=1 Tax=Tumebacillus algifaecis TaxID=1214604 RepID=A0A223D571_9BACL|nr:hypothetical protein [Tumebacillus algifaecis]ASS76721.1 hypothetical protein CIG75_18445 [Tumebacillus algifaecis]
MYLHRTTLTITATILASALLIGCGTKEKITPGQQQPIDEPTAAAIGSQAPAKPTLNMKVAVSGNQATITFLTTNIKLAPEHYSGLHIPGEGHIHLFVDGSVTRIGVKENTYRLQNLTKGKHTLEATLHTNNHQPYNVKDTTEFVVD